MKTTFFTHYLSNLNPEGEVSSSKIDGFKGNYISKLKWVWQAQSMSYVLQILGNSLLFEDKQMIFVALFDISTGLRFQKILKSFPIQVLSHPWFVRPFVRSSQNFFFIIESACFTGTF